MLEGLLAGVPPDALKIALVFALSFFIGLEREEHKQRQPTYAFGGVRTFPLIGLVSYASALISAPGLVPWSVGFAVVGGFMLLSYRHKLESDSPPGLTTEISALATYVVGALVQRELYWIATTIAVLEVLLLELKKALEGLTSHFESGEIVTVAKFLVLSVVVLPIVPDRDFTGFHLNPFRTWLVVVAVSGVSFASYVLQRIRKERGGVLLAALLGGAYSSTVTTVVLSRQAKEQPAPNLFSGAILAACGTMYARLVVLVAFFDFSLAIHLAPAFVGLAAAGIVVGCFVSLRGEAAAPAAGGARAPRNPLALGAALLFAAVFVAIVIVTTLVRRYLGASGLYGLAAVMGVTDVDPFILGLAQGGFHATDALVAERAIVIAAASNNVVKAGYAYAFSDRATGRRSFGLLLAFALLGVAPLLWL